MDGLSPEPIQGETFDDKLDSIASLLASKRNIIALVGAGISVSAGIPDFRSATGLYNTLNYQELGLASPEDLFDIEVFRDDPRPFFKFAHALYPGSIDPSPSHYFLANLDRQRILRRIYTQNIDALEQLSGVRPEKIVYAHGSLSSATCMKCQATYSANDIASDVESGRVPICRRPRNKKAKNSSGHAEKEQPPAGAPAEKHSMRLRVSSAKSKIDDDYDLIMKQGFCGGVIKPNVTFFGEKLGNEVGRNLQQDSVHADALIVMGTSLSVAPMSKVVQYLRPDIPRILINRNIVKVPKVSNNKDDYLFHACLLGDCDVVVEALVQKMKGNDAVISPTTGKEHGGAIGLVTSDETWLQNQPKESILLFRGAVVSNSDEADIRQELVVHCDGCQHEIEGQVFCCKTCFDYDLCSACYPSCSLLHAHGKHEFEVER